MKTPWLAPLIVLAMALGLIATAHGPGDAVGASRVHGNPVVTHATATGR